MQGIGPSHTPQSVKTLIWATVVVSLLSPVLTYLFNHTFHMSGPAQWLPLSYSGLARGWFWQPFTYFFLQTTGVGITLSLFITLTFQMLLLWFAGSEIDARFGSRLFLLFYLGTAIVVGLLSAALILSFGSASVVIGSSPAVYALITIWVMLNAELQIYFLFFIRIKVKWLAALLLGFALVTHLSYGLYIPFFADLMAIVGAYIFGRIVWKLPDPFPLNLEFPKRKRGKKESNIIDITVFQESDEAFMDRMLDKITRLGKESLTRRERNRMEKISATKKKK